MNSSTGMTVAIATPRHRRGSDVQKVSLPFRAGNQGVPWCGTISVFRAGVHAGQRGGPFDRCPKQAVAFGGPEQGVVMSTAQFVLQLDLRGELGANGQRQLGVERVHAQGYVPLGPPLVRPLVRGERAPVVSSVSGNRFTDGPAGGLAPADRSRRPGLESVRTLPMSTCTPPPT